MNKAESERLGSYFEMLGYRPVSKPEQADLIVLNTCVVRQNAEDKVINKLLNLKALKKKNPRAVLAVTGCFISSDTEKLKESYPFVDHFFKPGAHPAWLGENTWPIPPENPEAVTYVPIIQGCNNFCTFCIVPYRRGREKSRPPQEIINEIKTLADKGVQEVTLLGQNVDSYGKDLEEKVDLADLLGELDKVEHLKRIRFLTNYPRDMSGKLINAIANCPKVCESLNLPVQAGDDEILKAMKRGYTAEEFKNLVGEIRQKVPHIALTTDVIVGFPGETEKQFDNTYNLLKSLRFDTVHIAVYSTREGTFAARHFEDNVPDEEKKRRFCLLEQLNHDIAESINRELEGKVLEVLVEGKSGDKWRGRTRSDKLVFLRSAENLTGKLVNVIIEDATPWSLQGELVK